jgi:hypothetical protein
VVYYACFERFMLKIYERQRYSGSVGGIGNAEVLG